MVDPYAAQILIVLALIPVGIAAVHSLLGVVEDACTLGRGRAMRALRRWRS